MWSHQTLTQSHMGTKKPRTRASGHRRTHRKLKLIPRQRLDTPRPQEVYTQYFTRSQLTAHHFYQAAVLDITTRTLPERSHGARKRRFMQEKQETKHFSVGSSGVSWERLSMAATRRLSLLPLKPLPLPLHTAPWPQLSFTSYIFHY